MPKVYCVATIEEPKQIDNLVRYLKTLGLSPEVNNHNVSIDYEGGSRKLVMELVDLFQQYPYHGISVLG